MRQKRKILIFSHFYYPHVGGVERFAGDLARCLVRDHGYDACIVTFNTENSREVAVSDGVTIYRLPSRLLLGGRYPVPKLSGRFFSLFTDICKEDADIYLIHTRFSISSLLGAFLARFKRKPLVLIEHGSAHFQLNGRFITALGKAFEHAISRFTGAWSDLAFGVSESCCRWLRHFHIEAADVIYNGVDIPSADIDGSGIRAELGIDDDRLIIAYAGRVIKEKGVRELLEAFDMLAGEHNNLCLVVAGDGDLLPELKEAFGDRNDVIFTGRIQTEKVHELLAATEIFAHPSNYPEGLPGAVIEAGLQKCAVVATAQGGTEEIIPDEQHGIIIERVDAETICRASDELLSDQDKRKTLAENLHQRVVDRFDRKKSVAKLALYLKNLSSLI